MDFTSLTFLFIFLPIFTFLYLLAKPSLRIVLVLFASIIFLAVGQPVAIAWFAGIGLTGYILGRLIKPNLRQEKAQPQWWLWLGIGLNLGLLITFKVLNNHALAISFGNFQLSHLVTPLGLSYLTFQSISYLVDVSRNVIQAEKDIIKFFTYILFFPKLVSGPITRYKSFGDQLSLLDPSINDIASGLRRIFSGVLKRILIANQLGIAANAVFNLQTPNIEPYYAWLALIAYTLQIYFDFSGYTDIAIGLGKVIGINLPENFNFPYTAQSISDFWRRWHITLSTWFREYVFYPLERHRFKFAGQQINLVIVFLLTGLWHGFTLNFLIWGLIHGTAIAFESAGGGKWLKTLWQPLRHLYTLLILLVGWVFFRSTSVGFAIGFLSRLVGISPEPTILPFSQTAPFPILEPSLILIMMTALILSLPTSSLWKNFRIRVENSNPAYFFVLQTLEDAFILGLLILSVAAHVSGNFLPNIYAKF